MTVLNEDDHFDVDKAENNFAAAISEYASWGYFDYRFQGEGCDEGYQSIPVSWGISSERKGGFSPCLVEASHHNKKGFECDQAFGLLIFDLNKFD